MNELEDDQQLVLVGNRLSGYGALLCRKLFSHNQAFPLRMYARGDAYRCDRGVVTISHCYFPVESHCMRN